MRSHTLSNRVSEKKSSHQFRESTLHIKQAKRHKQALQASSVKRLPPCILLHNRPSSSHIKLLDADPAQALLSSIELSCSLSSTIFLRRTSSLLLLKAFCLPLPLFGVWMILMSLRSESRRPRGPCSTISSTCNASLLDQLGDRRRQQSDTSTHHVFPGVTLSFAGFGTVLPGERCTERIQLVEIRRRLFSSREKDVSSRPAPLRKVRPHL